MFFFENECILYTKWTGYYCASVTSLHPAINLMEDECGDVKKIIFFLYVGDDSFHKGLSMQTRT